MVEFCAGGADVNPPVGKKRGRGHETNDQKTVSASERVQTYTKEPFTVSRDSQQHLALIESLI